VLRFGPLTRLCPASRSLATALPEGALASGLPPIRPHLGQLSLPRPAIHTTKLDGD
jgi:hypothetical protein